MLCAVLSRRGWPRATRSGRVRQRHRRCAGRRTCGRPRGGAGHRFCDARQPVGKGTACFGEVGLTGDVRYVSGAQRRTSEMAKMGFGRIIRPEGTSDGRRQRDERREVSTLEEAVAVALLSPQRRHLPAELARALELVAPGTDLREAIDNVMRAHNGA